MTLGLRSGQFRRPNNEVRLPLRELEVLPNLALHPLLIALRCACVRSLVHALFISGNSKPAQDRSEWDSVLNRHGLK